MSNGKTIGELIEEMRLKAGAKEYHGHEYMALERFADDTRHMIIFDVLTKDSLVGWQGERTRLFLTDEGYRKSLENQEKGHIKILSHARVVQGHLHYDKKNRFVDAGMVVFLPDPASFIFPDSVFGLRRWSIAGGSRKQDTESGDQYDKAERSGAACGVSEIYAAPAQCKSKETGC